MSNHAVSVKQISQLKDELSRCSTLPSLPAVALKVIDASKDPNIGLAEIAEIIRMDPALSAKLLKIANSPLYSLRRTVHNLREALTLLGLNAALTIALSFTLVRSLKSNAPPNDNHDIYWRRSLLSATIARFMGRKLGLANLEDLFLASLLQDIGILAIHSIRPDLYDAVNVNTSNHESLIEYERRVLSADHAEIGSWLLQSWNFPEKLYHSVLKSHHTKTSNFHASEDELFQQCINLSGKISDAWLTDNKTNILTTNLKNIETILNINGTEFTAFIAEINELLPEVSSLFEIDIIDSKSCDDVLEEAKEILLIKNLEIIKLSEESRSTIKNMEAKTRDLEEVSRRDPLTNLYHRKYFEDKLKEEFDSSNKNRWPLSLAFIDLDDFKIVNDTYGHLVGDQVLKDIATFFMRHIRQTDILARYGGDEFILLLPGSTAQVAENTLNRLLKELREQYTTEVDGVTVKQTISIGLATHMDGNSFKNTTEFLSATDQALYTVKDAGRDSLACFEV